MALSQCQTFYRETLPLLVNAVINMNAQNSHRVKYTRFHV